MTENSAGLGHGCRQHADRLGWHWHEPGRALWSRSRRYESVIQCDDDSIGADDTRGPALRNFRSPWLFAALNEQDLLCRAFGNCLAGDPLDRELGSLIPGCGPLAAGQKLFTYLRYNAELTRQGLDAIGCTTIKPEAVQKLDAIDSIPELLAVGAAVAKQKVKEDHFAKFLPA